VPDAIPEVVLEVVAFNWDTTSSTDGLNLRRNATTGIVLPEWREGFSTRPEDSPAAYSITDTAGVQVSIQARFRHRDGQPGTIEVRAHEEQAGGNVLGRVRARTVTFGAGGQTPMEPFELEDVKLSHWGVGVRTVAWRWEYRAGGGDWKSIATSRHLIYSLVSVPKPAWQQQPFAPGNVEVLWTEVLNYACEWARGAHDEGEAARLVTEAVYRLGPAAVTYDCVGGGATHYANFGFDCTAFLERLGGGVGNGYYVNCTDCATITSTFANALGCDLWQSKMGWNFELNDILGIGSTTWQQCCPGWTSFSYHEVAFSGACGVADHVWDACLQVNGGPDPTTAPRVALLPTDMLFGNPGAMMYRDRLASVAGRPNCNPQPATRVRRVIS